MRCLDGELEHLEVRREGDSAEDVCGVCHGHLQRERAEMPHGDAWTGVRGEERVTESVRAEGAAQGEVEVLQLRRVAEYVAEVAVLRIVAADVAALDAGCFLSNTH